MEQEQQLFYRDTWAEIDLDAIAENMSSICSFLPKETKVFAAVKANAYGHGDVQVAKTVLNAGAQGLAVAFLDEAITLRNNGITAPILILGATRPKDAGLAARLRVSVTVFQLEWLQEAETYIQDDLPLQVHIKCDTGMGRIGIRDKRELRIIEKYIFDSPSFNFEGIFTHFATADQVEDHYYQQQLSKFQSFLQCLQAVPPYVHAANSAAALIHKDALFNSVRIGIALYGLTPSEEISSLLPFQRKEAFSLHTRIIHVKLLQPGEKVGYGADYTAASQEWIATIPIGYADGWIRKLRGFEVIADGERVPIVGKICMDQTMIKLPRSMPIGTKVTLIGKQKDQTISVDDVARKLDTINYEVTCMISSRVPRVYQR